MLIYRHRSLVTGIVRLSAVAASMLMLTVLIVSNSRAAFSDTTDNVANSFTTGSVVITDDATAAMFTSGNMKPGTPVVECIRLSYTGSVTDAYIRMYGSTDSGALAPYLNTKIEIGTTGAFGNCSGFDPAPTGPLYEGTLANLATAHGNWANGIPNFTASTNPTHRTLRFTFEVQDNNAAQNLDAGATFTWEARDSNA